MSHNELTPRQKRLLERIIEYWLDLELSDAPYTTAEDRDHLEIEMSHVAAIVKKLELRVDAKLLQTKPKETAS
jgi:hypothetical protein